MAVLDNHLLDDDILVALAADVDDVVRAHAAGAARGHPLIEEILARSPDTTVRQILAHSYVGESKGLRRLTQEILAHDEDVETRLRVAETTEHRDLFEVLLRDAHPSVRGQCAANPRALRADVETLLHDSDRRARAMAVTVGLRYPDRAQLITAASDRSIEVRWAVLFRAGAPREAAMLLIHDSDEVVRHHAELFCNGEGLWEATAEEEALEDRRTMLGSLGSHSWTDRPSSTTDSAIEPPQTT